MNTSLEGPLAVGPPEAKLIVPFDSEGCGEIGDATALVICDWGERWKGEDVEISLTVAT